MDGCTLSVIGYVLLNATLISNVMIFGQAYIERVEGQTPGADRARSDRGRTDSCPLSTSSSCWSSSLMPFVSQASPPFNQPDNLLLSPSARLRGGVHHTILPESIEKKMALHYRARMSSIRDR